jgi:hypothetical protein
MRLENDFKQCAFKAVIYVNACEDELLIVARGEYEILFRGAIIGL